MKVSKVDRRVLKIGFLLTLILACVLALTYWIVADDWAYRQFTATPLSPDQFLPALSGGDVVEQKFSVDGEQLDTISLYTSVFKPDAKGEMLVEALQNDSVIAEQTLPISALAAQGYTSISLPDVCGAAGTPLTLRLTVRSDETQVMTFYFGTTVIAGKVEIDAAGLDGLTLNGAAVRGRLSMRLESHTIHSIAGQYFLVGAGAILLCLCLVIVLAWKKAHHRKSLLLLCVALGRRYSFLIQQLVARDFNTKYRRSVLGVLWSFLNPLLTMAVQYIVFSTLFRSNIDNFPVYLMTGIILFNFFSEAAGLGLDSIVTSASLITKVYIPKMIFPVSRVLSSLINLVISFVPLLLMILVTGMPVHRSILLLPVVVVLLTLFCFGMSFLLATANVFFRDTRFLWGIVVLLWTYLTPIFYPETIIPASLIHLYHMNPMYQFIYFLRTITLGGVAPAPITFVYCTLAAVVPLGVGLWVFRKNQDKFILRL